MSDTKRIGAPAGSGSSRAAPPSLADEIRKPARLGLFLILLFFGVGGVWAAKAPLSSAVIASGLVSPQASRQTVQHLEGGIIRKIRVSEGDRVKKGDVLVVLQDVSAQAEVGSASTRLRLLAAKEARLDAERRGNTTIKFGHSTLADTSDSNVRDIREQQRDQLQARLANDASRKSIMTQRIVQLEKQINGYERQLVSAKNQYALIGEEIKVVTDLFRKGLERKPRLLALKRTRAQLLGTRGELKSLIARADEAIGETRLRIINLDVERQEAIAAELSDVGAQRAELEQKIKSSRDRLERTEIVAPIAGTVLNLRFKTHGGVIKSGEPILDLVPQEDGLVIEARVRPTDIDEVQIGQRAYVMFPGLPQRNLLRIEGQVTRVAADALVDDSTGNRYYDARVVIDRETLTATASDIELTPGMPADVFIGTGERTMLEFILQPFLQTLERTFRES